MKGTWIIQDNHLAIKCEKEILHLNATDVYEILQDDKAEILEGLECEPLMLDFPNLRISKVGSDIKCLLENGTDNSIHMTLFCLRRKEKIIIDMIDGNIIDQCVFNNEWFYITGCSDELSHVFTKAAIKHTGEITISQYISIIRNPQIFGRDSLINNVETSLLDKVIDTEQDLPSGLHAKLYAYQKTGYFWMKYMLNENSGCILGDEMGLGKTLQVITLMLQYKYQNKSPMLVVAPVSLLQNWKRECERFAPQLKTLIHHGSHRTGRYKDLLEYDLIIISYNSAVSDSSLLKTH